MQAPRHSVVTIRPRALSCTAFALAMLWNAGADAQSVLPPPTDVLVVTASTGGPPPTLPVPSQSSCDAHLPAGRAISRDANPTLFWYRLTPDGSLHDISLYRSSGDSDLDNAALACANDEHVRPQFVAGKPTEIVWVGGINWSNAAHVFFEPAPDGAHQVCRIPYPRLRSGGFSRGSSRSDTGSAPMACRITPRSSVQAIVPRSTPPP